MQQTAILNVMTLYVDSGMLKNSVCSNFVEVFSLTEMFSYYITTFPEGEAVCHCAGVVLLWSVELICVDNDGMSIKVQTPDSMPLYCCPQMGPS